MTRPIASHGDTGTEPVVAELLRHDGQLVRVLADGAGTGGACTLLEVWAPVGSGLPCHVHDLEDETVHVLDGHVRVCLGPTVRDAGPGEVVHLPRGVPHRVVAVSAEARFLALHVPAGIERFLRATADQAAAGPLAVDDDVAALLAAAGLRLLPHLEVA